MPKKKRSIPRSQRAKTRPKRRSAQSVIERQAKQIAKLKEKVKKQKRTIIVKDARIKTESAAKERAEERLYRRRVSEWVEKVQEIEDDEEREDMIEFIRDNDLIEFDDWLDILTEELDMSEHDAYELWYYP